MGFCRSNVKLCFYLSCDIADCILNTQRVQDRAFVEEFIYKDYKRELLDLYVKENLQKEAWFKLFGYDFGGLCSGYTVFTYHNQCKKPLRTPHHIYMLYYLPYYKYGHIQQGL